MIACELCANKHEGNYGSGRFCSPKCARTFSTKKDRIAISQKVSAKLKGKKFGAALHPNPHRGPRKGKPRYKIKCKNCGTEIKTYVGEDRQYCNGECWKKKSGGFRENNVGQGKCGWYDKIFFQSTWEVGYYLWCKSKGFSFTRNKEYFFYSVEGKQYKYYPDFLVNNEIVEIKGRITDLDSIKLSAVPRPVKLLSWNELTDVFEFIKNSYNCDISDIWTKL